jgi:hypothetical protein
MINFTQFHIETLGFEDVHRLKIFKGIIHASKRLKEKEGAVRGKKLELSAINLLQKSALSQVYSKHYESFASDLSRHRHHGWTR